MTAEKSGRERSREAKLIYIKGFENALRRNLEWPLDSSLNYTRELRFITTISIFFPKAPQLALVE